MYAIRNTFYWILVLVLIAWTVYQAATLITPLLDFQALLSEIPDTQDGEWLRLGAEVGFWTVLGLRVVLWALVTTAVGILALLIRPRTEARPPRRRRATPRTEPTLD